jgi:hypothetical protein
MHFMNMQEIKTSQLTSRPKGFPLGPACSIVAFLRKAILSLASLANSFLKEPMLALLLFAGPLPPSYSPPSGSIVALRTGVRIARFASLLHTALICHWQERCSEATGGVGVSEPLETFGGQLYYKYKPMQWFAWKSCSIANIMCHYLNSSLPWTFPYTVPVHLFSSDDGKG